MLVCGVLLPPTIARLQPRVRAARQHLLICGLGLLWSLLGASAARADATPEWPTRLVLRAGATCLDRAQLQARVEPWLADASIDPDLRVEVFGSERDERHVSFRILRSDTPVAERAFAPGPVDCSELHAVVGLAIALGLKVSSRGDAATEPVPELANRLSVGAGLLGTWHVIPGLGAGVTLSTEFRFEAPIAIGIGVAGVRGQTQSASRGAGEFSTMAARFDLTPCVLTGLTPKLEARLCVGVEGWLIAASGRGFDVSKDALLNQFGLTGSAGLQVHIMPNWAIVGMIGVSVPTRRIRISVLDPSGGTVEMYTGAALGGRLSLGLAHEL